MRCMICGNDRAEERYRAWPFMPPTANWHCCRDCYESPEVKAAVSAYGKYEPTRGANVGDEIIMIYLPDNTKEFEVTWRKDIPFKNYFLKTGKVTKKDEYGRLEGTWGDYLLWENAGDLLGHVNEM